MYEYFIYIEKSTTVEISYVEERGSLLESGRVRFLF